jgi:hypothetical protein
MGFFNEVGISTQVSVIQLKSLLPLLKLKVYALNSLWSKYFLSCPHLGTKLEK